jgi:hypothetical protein
VIYASRRKGKARARNGMADPTDLSRFGCLVRALLHRNVGGASGRAQGRPLTSRLRRRPGRQRQVSLRPPLTPLTLWQSEDRNPLCSNRFDKRIRVCSLPVAHDVFGIWSLRCSLVRHRWPD